MGSNGFNADVETFRDFLRIRSVSGEGPGGSYAQAVAWLERLCHKVGLKTQQVEPVKGKPVLLASWSGRNPKLPALLLNSHYDVVSSHGRILERGPLVC